MNEQRDCRGLINSLSDYLDGELDAHLCEELERHLKDCEDCRVVVNTLRKTIDLYHAHAGEEPLPEDVRSRLYHRLDLTDFLDRHANQP
jgi:anti-sigma factor (TIGR02949 family)